MAKYTEEKKLKFSYPPGLKHDSNNQKTFYESSGPERKRYQWSGRIEAPSYFLLLKSVPQK